MANNTTISAIARSGPTVVAIAASNRLWTVKYAEKAPITNPNQRIVTHTEFPWGGMSPPRKKIPSPANAMAPRDADVVMADLVSEARSSADRRGKMLNFIVVPIIGFPLSHALFACSIQIGEIFDCKEDEIWSEYAIRINHPRPIELRTYQLVWTRSLERYAVHSANLFLSDGNAADLFC
ncbi:hypothetical protein FHS76_004183 [Ochrobactrum daejeonense]|uniref:Uncharacterized protein n=1 Tax=Brucella daejeonensis TaxID=659015 RepID=A0A7W9EPY9_9HYPH|nr:hypothetical protein [Brucella daejeonensis]MBB5704266.1 hypothetical protein [Brucella daejeonensis]